ncbi:hypothetical protein T09_2569 [Trichinella sp. T9]|nr:hypothetical protein T09_8388 [Trichinella sp. T9]KRX61293.1 hypothetical protein T09_2569 [Trichinella sp. T9]
MLFRSFNSQRIRYPTRYLSNVKNAVRRVFALISHFLLCRFYSYQNTEISITEWVKSNRNSLGLNQEAACNTLNSREIIR